MSHDFRIVVRIRKDTNEWETLADKTFSDMTERKDQEFTLNNTTETVWDPTNSSESVDSFECLILSSDQDVEVELTANEGDADEELIHFTLKAGVPFILGSDDSRYSYTTDAFAGTLDVIDKIRVKETNSVTATVRLILEK